MLADGWIPDSGEAKDIDLVSKVVIQDATLLSVAQETVQVFLVGDFGHSFGVMVSYAEVC